MKTFLRNYTLSICIICIIIYLSFFTPPSNDVPTFNHMDKLVHFCMYGGLTTILWSQYYWCHRKIKWSHLIVGGMICPILMSGLIEIGQSELTDTRSGEWLDFFANTLGVCTATLFCHFIVKKKIYQLKQKKNS